MINFKLVKQDGHIIDMSRLDETAKNSVIKGFAREWVDEEIKRLGEGLTVCSINQEGNYCKGMWDGSLSYNRIGFRIDGDYLIIYKNQFRKIIN